jgi:hypothetical protein
MSQFATLHGLRRGERKATLHTTARIAFQASAIWEAA